MRTTSIFDLFGQSVRIDLRYGSQLLHFHFVKKKTLNARSNNNTQQQGITEKEKKHAHTHYSNNSNNAMSSELCLLNEHTGTVWYLLVVVNSFHWNFMENNGEPKVFQHPIRRRSNTTLLPNIVEKPTIFVRCTRASLNAGGNFGRNR